MNTYTLKFENLNLETKYSAYVYEMQSKRVLEYLQFINLSLVICLIYYSLTKQIIQIVYIIACLIGICIYYYVAQNFRIEYQIFLYKVMMLVVPYFTLSMLYLQDMSPLVAANVLIWLLMFQQLYQATTNFLHDFVAFTNTIIIIYVYNYLYFGLNTFSFIWLPLYLAHLKLKYYSMKNMKLLFKESQINQSICNSFIYLDQLMRETATERFFCCELDQETLEYRLELTNIVDFDLNQFLTTSLVTIQENLKTYLFKKIDTNRATQSTKESLVILTPTNKKQKISLYIQYYPKLKYFIQLQDTNGQKSDSIVYQSKIYQCFYKSVIKKLQRQSISQTSMQNLIHNFTAGVYLMDICEQPIKYLTKNNFDILPTINSLCQNMNALFRAQKTEYWITSNKVVFETYYYNLIKMVKTSNNKLIISIMEQQNQIQIILGYMNRIKVKFQDQNSKHYEKMQTLNRILSSSTTIIQNHQIITYIDNCPEVPFI